MRTIASPWAETFESLLDGMRHHAMFASPYVTARPLMTIMGRLGQAPNRSLDLLTNLNVENLVSGSTDAAAILNLVQGFPATRVRHLPGLHAKVYVIDETKAIITSANLTEPGLFHNYEYGIEIDDPLVVRQIAEDLSKYGHLGAEVPVVELEEIAKAAEELRERHAAVLRSSRRQLAQDLDGKLEQSRELLRVLRARTGESTTTIFSRTLLYVLRYGPLTTDQIHTRVKQIHPDLCDDSIDRVIRGVHFGKRWKHMVRNAQQSLKARGLIGYDGGRWHLKANAVA